MSKRSYVSAKPSDPSASNKRSRTNTCEFGDGCTRFNVDHIQKLHGRLAPHQRVGKSSVDDIELIDKMRITNDIKAKVTGYYSRIKGEQYEVGGKVYDTEFFYGRNLTLNSLKYNGTDLQKKCTELYFDMMFMALLVCEDWIQQKVKNQDFTNVNIKRMYSLMTALDGDGVSSTYSTDGTYYDKMNNNQNFAPLNPIKISLLHMFLYPSDHRIKRYVTDASITNKKHQGLSPGALNTALQQYFPRLSQSGGQSVSLALSASLLCLTTLFSALVTR